MRSMKYFAVFLVLFILLSPLAYAPEEHLLPLQGTAKLNTVRMEGGNLIIEIYDAPSGGNLVYNSTNDFLNVISGGAYDILLGNGTQPLSLNYGTKYYMDIYINGVDVDFNSSERQVFMSTVGNLTVTTPIRTSSNDADDALNISNGGSFFSGNVSVNGTFNITANNGTVRTAGAVAILDSDRDSALNISVGGAFVGGDMVFNNFFNVTTTASAARTNGTVTILSLLSPALSINGFNVSGSNAALSTNGTVTILSLLGPAFTINYGFNISGTSGNLRTNGTIAIYNPDVDDALNITSGGTSLRGNLTVGLRDGGSAGILINEQGSIIIGNASSTNQPRLDIYDGGADNCGYIRLFDENGDPHYLYVASTGELMINIGEPSTCANTDGTKVGAQ